MYANFNFLRTLDLINIIMSHFLFVKNKLSMFLEFSFNLTYCLRQEKECVTSSDLINVKGYKHLKGIHSLLSAFLFMNSCGQISLMSMQIFVLL